MKDTLATRLRNARLNAGFRTQEALAEATKLYTPTGKGLGRSMISKLEAGIRPNPSLQTLLVLSRTLGCLIDDLVPPGELLPILREDPTAYKTAVTLLCKRITAKIDRVDDATALERILEYIEFIQTREG